ncbi:hypothetical protein BWO91_17615 [Plantibacter flavus]|uniref:DUF4393 domain-containing protein n=1 Tax=Plantibacter flavus TaxID=150123 RepID=UPI00099B86B1|nr:DUF4393 domain-containing protein [Plantibacter flavus]AQX81539.1 hypothetical protein BWO91_17615 [Plantibacter flavus]
MGEESGPLGQAKEVIGVTKAVLDIAKENPAARAAGNDAAEALSIIARSVKNVLLPIAAINFGLAKAEAYFKGKFAADMSQKLIVIPESDVVEPKASIAGPALQGLAFSHDEDELRELYLSLLATAMDGRAPDAAHPAFVEIIRQLSAAEVESLSAILRSPGLRVIVEIRLSAGSQPNSYTVFARHVMIGMWYPKHVLEVEPWVDNWIRLGLIEVDYTIWSAEEKSYDWVEKSQSYNTALTDAGGDAERVTWEKGLLRKTAFGQKFAEAVGVLPVDTASD